MGKIPRKIAKENVIGYVICRFGLLACQDRDDKRKLIALAQIYHAAVKRGALIESRSTLPQANAELITNQERDAGSIIQSHALKNLHVSFEEVDLIIKVLGREKIRFVRMWRIKRILKRK